MSAPHIAALLIRGRAAFEEHLRKIHTEQGREMPLGIGGLNIVTRGDFCSYPKACLDFVGPGRSLHILSEDGSVKALLTHHLVRTL